MKRTIAIFLLFALLIAAPFLGSESVAFRDLFTPGTLSHQLLFEFRIPRLVFVCIVGGTLAWIGASYQALLNNVLAEPYVLGISSSVSLGMVGSHFLLGVPFEGPVSILIGTVSGILLTLFILALVSRSQIDISNQMILFGMACNFFLSSLLFLVLSYFNQQIGGGSLHWLFGHIPWANYFQTGLAASVSLSALFVTWLFGKKLDAILLGPDVAKTLGVSAFRVQLFLLSVTSAVLSFLIAHTGAIGFVGLVTPHIAKILFRPRTSRSLLLYSFLTGAVFLIFSDILSRVLLPPFEFPIGIVTTLIGGPLFLFLLRRNA